MPGCSTLPISRYAFEAYDDDGAVCLSSLSVRVCRETVCQTYTAHCLQVGSATSSLHINQNECLVAAVVSASIQFHALLLQDHGPATAMTYSVQRHQPGDFTFGDRIKLRQPRAKQLQQLLCF